MLTTIISAVIIGAIIGAVARLVLPGVQTISPVVTVLLGIIGAGIATWLTGQFGYKNSNGGFAFIPFIVGVIAASGLIVAYGAITGRKQI